MITCPKCGKPVGGRARACGYCGASLVNDYFTKEDLHALLEEKPLGPGGAAAVTLYLFGSVALFTALAFQFLGLMGFGPAGLVPHLDWIWWVRTLILAIPAMILLMQTLLLQGHRKSLWMDTVWLFFAACGLFFTILVYLEDGTGLFYGLPSLPYLIVVGVCLIVVGAITSILSFER